MTRPRPTYKRELLEESKGAQEPVTEVEYSEDGHTLRVHAIQEYDGVAYRAMIRSDARSDSDPTVSLARSRWESDVGQLRDWTALATGRLSGPKDLPAWESLFTVFNAALGAYYDETVEPEERTIPQEGKSR